MWDVTVIWCIVNSQGQRISSVRTWSSVRMWNVFIALTLTLVVIFSLISFVQLHYSLLAVFCSGKGGLFLLSRSEWRVWFVVVVLSRSWLFTPSKEKWPEDLRLVFHLECRKFVYFFTAQCCVNVHLCIDVCMFHFAVVLYFNLAQLMTCKWN